MSRCLYSRSNYKIIKQNRNSYLVINIDKDFNIGHTHVYNYNIAKIIIYCCIKGDFPSRIKNLRYNKRVLQSIIRICSNKYLRKFQIMLNELEDKEKIIENTK